MEELEFDVAGEVSEKALLVETKGGVLTAIDLGTDSSVGALKDQIRKRAPWNDEASDIVFIGKIAAAKDHEFVADYVKLDKSSKVSVRRPWKSFYGTYLTEQLQRRFPNMSLLKVQLFNFAISLVCVPLMYGFSEAYFYLPSNSEVPYSLQTLGVFLCAFLVGAWSTLSVALYLAAGAIGLHVFAAHKGGWTYMITAPTAGFLWGFLLTAVVVGILVTWRGWDRNFYTWLLACIIGWACTFAPGLIVLAGKLNSWPLAFKYGLTPFLAAEAVKFTIITTVIPLTWLITSRILNSKYNRSTFFADCISFFNPRLISF
eukprot:TRINITY_DN7189_c0_g1_i2.p1 TRINITY_DN7189_c0_g1~~TRINITY_DN7189_c0_g1_i2.p1  ORF type:complete len:324 (+),score=13.98 TRINITY_DN7189_c0_g1_i2:25-972(+)